MIPALSLRVLTLKADEKEYEASVGRTSRRSRRCRYDRSSIDENKNRLRPQTSTQIGDDGKYLGAAWHERHFSSGSDARPGNVRAHVSRRDVIAQWARVVGRRFRRARGKRVRED